MIGSLPSAGLTSTLTGNYNNESGEKLQRSHCSVAVKHPVSFLFRPRLVGHSLQRRARNLYHRFAARPETSITM